MNQEEANKRYKEWGVLLLLNAPENIEFGIDNTSWKTGKKFKGVKLIPFGSHIIYYSLKSENYQFKISSFFNITPENRVVIKKWSDKFEDFLSVDKTEQERYEHGVNDFSLDQYLGPYPLERFEIWKEVSNYIDQRVLDKLNPIEKKMHLEDQEYKNQEQEQREKKEAQKEIMKNLYGEDFGEEIDLEQYDDEKIAEDFDKQMSMGTNNDQNNENNDQNKEENPIISEENIEENKNSINQEKKQEKQERIKQAIKQEQEFQDKCDKEDFSTIAGTIYYTDIPKKLFTHGVKGSELTQLNIDKTDVFKKLLKKNYDDDYKFFFGELQYAFNNFILGEHLDSLEQWKTMFAIVTSCDSYMEQNQQFGIDLIPVIYGILKQFPKDFFIDNISKDNFLSKCLFSFIEVCEQEQSKKLRNRVQKLKQMLEEKFIFIPQAQLIENEEGKYVYDMDDEDAPTIVNPDEFYSI